MFVNASASRNTTIKSHGYYWDSYNYLECKWHIQKESKLNSSYVLRVVFNYFDLAGESAFSSSVCPYDNLTFYDGYSDLSPLLGSYCGTVHPEVIYSTGSDLYIKFNTDNAYTSRGFSISVLAVHRGVLKEVNTDNNENLIKLICCSKKYINYSYPELFGLNLNSPWFLSPSPLPPSPFPLPPSPFPQEIPVLVYTWNLWIFFLQPLI